MNQPGVDMASSPPLQQQAEDRWRAFFRITDISAPESVDELQERLSLNVVYYLFQYVCFAIVVVFVGTVFCHGGIPFLLAFLVSAVVSVGCGIASEKHEQYRLYFLLLAFVVSVASFCVAHVAKTGLLCFLFYLCSVSLHAIFKQPSPRAQSLFTTTNL